MNFGLTGNPLGHSLSKVIHEKLFKIKNIKHCYDLYPSENLDALFKKTLSELDGFNITIPYKTDIIKYLDKVDDKVSLYNSCNTVVKDGAVYKGYNTDVYGFLNTLKKCNIDLKSKKVLVLGSGGVARMMVFESVLNGAEVYITSRNKEKCKEIKEEVCSKINKQIFVVEDTDGLNFDVLLNGTPCGMFPNELSLPLAFEKIMNVPFVFDTIYNPKETLLTRLSAYCGNDAENGLYMLVEQAAVAQEHFCGLKYSKEEVELVADSIDISPLSLNKNIILIGPPGSGKTTIGTELSKLLNLKFIDTDEEIVKEHGEIPAIFENHGEQYFRQLESKVILKLASSTNQLISTGGGMVENSEVMKQISEDKNNIVLFINPDYDLLLSRTAKSDNRPLLVGDTAEKLKKLLTRRLPLYEMYANVKVDVKEEQPVKLTVIQCVDKLCDK